VTVNSTQSYAVNAAAVDDSAPAQKRPRVQTTIVPTNRIIADVTECHSLIRYTSVMMPLRILVTVPSIDSVGYRALDRGCM